MQACVQQLIPLLGLEHTELENFHEVDVTERQIQQKRRVRLRAVKVRKTDRGSKLPALRKQDCWKWIGFRRIGVHRARAQRTDQLAAAKQVDVSIKRAAGFVAGANRIDSPLRLSRWAKGVLYRGVHLTLQLQEIPDGEILRFQPAQEGVIVFRGAR